MKEVTFRTEGEQHILVHKGIDLASYFGDLPFGVARSGFDPPRLPLKRMEVKVKYATALAKLRISNYLSHQCGEDGQVLNGHKFSVHCLINHRGMAPAGSLVNASPYRYWLIWWDEENYLRFMHTKGEPNYTRVKPPWV